jgi:integrase
MSTVSAALGPPASLAEVNVRIAAMQGLAEQRRFDLMSGVRGVAKVLGDHPADIPADPEALRRRLNHLTPAAAGMTKSRWRNVRALLTAALALTGTRVVRRRRREALAPAWLALHEGMKGTCEWRRLSRFFSYASANGIEPDKVDDQTVAGFAESLNRYSLAERQTQILRDFCRTWNNCAANIEGWPEAHLTVPDRRRAYALPAAAYPASFGAGVDAYLAHLASGDLFSKRGRGPASPTTLRNVRFRLYQTAAAWVLSGRPPDTILSLADLVEPQAIRAALRFLWSRNGGRKTGHLHNSAMMAITIAKHWIKSPQDQIEELQVIRREVDPKSTGMTVRNRARLRQFADPENLRRLIDLPEAILRLLPRSGPPSHAEAIRVQTALAIAILLVAPMRVKNLASLDVGRHVLRSRPGGARHIVIPAEEVKNRTALAFEVSHGVAEIMDVYLARCRPRLAKDRDGYLFPARKGGAKTPGQLAQQIKRTIATETGIDFNAHAFRHLAAMLFLREYPGEYETTRLILGHKSLSTTVNAYCGLEQADALRRLDALIDRHRRNPGDRHEPPNTPATDCGLAGSRSSAMGKGRRVKGAV